MSHSGPVGPQGMRNQTAYVYIGHSRKDGTLLGCEWIVLCAESQRLPLAAWTPLTPIIELGMSTFHNVDYAAMN